MMNSRNSVPLLVYLALGIALCLPVLSAKPFAAISFPQAPDNRKAMRDALQEAVNDLNLSDEQKGKVKDIFDDAKAKREAIWKDTSLTDDQKKDKMKELREETKSKVSEVLTPEQRAQLKEKMEAAKAKQPQ